MPVIDAPALFQTRTALEAEIVGHDRSKIAQAAVLLEKEVAGIPGVVSARSTVRRGRPEIVIRFDREALARYSLRLGDVAETIRNKVQGVIATRFTERERKIDVRTRLPEKDLTTAATLERLQINPGRDASPAARGRRDDRGRGRARRDPARRRPPRRDRLGRPRRARPPRRGPGRSRPARRACASPTATSSIPSSSASPGRTRSRRGRWTASCSRSRSRRSSSTC